MLQASTLKFLLQLASNNNKPWFDAHRDQYEMARTDFEKLAERVKQLLTPLVPELAEQQTKHCIFRIYKDVRFSKDKTPYKAHLSAYFSKGGRKYEGAGYYLHIEPGKSFVAGGLWMPSTALLKSVRQEIDYNFEEFKKIVESKMFRKYFGKLAEDKLKTLPKGYEASNPAIEYLKYKSFIAEHSFSDDDVLHQNFATACHRAFSAMQPLVDFINRSLD